MSLVITSRPTLPAQPPLRFLPNEESATYGLPYHLSVANRDGEIDPEVNRVLQLARAFASFNDDEANRSQALLTFHPADEEGMDLPLLREGDYTVGKRIAINYGETLDGIDTDQFEFARWLTEYLAFAQRNALLGRLELTIFYGEDEELSLETALARIEWLVSEDGHLVLTQPYALALGY